MRKKSIAAVLTAAFLTLTSGISAKEFNELTHTLFINEVVQSTFGGDLDLLMEYPDGWIELYNPGPRDINLAGYRIGKKNKFKKNYELPDITIKANGYLVVLCDKSDSVVVERTTDWWGNVTSEKKEIHTDFRITTDEPSALYLFNRDSLLVDSMALPKMPAVNVGIGRLTDGADSIGYEMNITKGARNEGGHALGVLPDAILSPLGFVGSPNNTIVNVKATKVARLKFADGTPIPSTAKVRYTTDGTEPCDTSKAFTTAGLYIKENTIVKAAVFCEGYLTANSVAGVYVFNNRRPNIPTVAIICDSLDLYGKDYGIITRNSRETKYNWRRPTYLSYFATGGMAAKFSQRGEVRISGAYTRDNKLKSMIVYAEDRLGTNDYFEQQFWPTTTPSVRKTPSIGLRDSGNDYGNSNMRDGIGQMMLGMYTDLDWQGFQPAIFYINQYYQGLINLRERANEDNIWCHYGGLKDVTVIENGELKKGDYQQYLDFVDFYSTPGRTYAEFDSVMDVVEYTNMIIDNIFMSNTDYPHNNNVLWRPSAEGGRWRWIIKDVDRAFGIWGHSSGEEYLKWLLMLENNVGESPSAEDYEYWTRLFRSLMAVPEYRDLFLDRFTVYMGDFLTPDNMNKWITWAHDLMANEWDDYSRAQGISGKGSWENTLNDMKRWGSERHTKMYNQLQEYYGLGSQIPVTVNKQTAPSSTQTVFINSVPLTAAVFDGKLYAGRKYSFTGTCSTEGYDVIGWNVAVTDANGKKTENTYMNNLLELTIKEGTKSVAINAIMGENGVEDNSAALSEVQSTSYFNAQGIESKTPHSGLNVVRYTLKNGTVISDKKYIK